MGTKLNPGAFDCYKNAEPDEPMFILLGRDPMAGYLVRLWAWWRRMRGEDERKINEARMCAEAMDAYAQRHGKPLRWLSLYALSRFLADINYAFHSRKPEHFVKPETPTVRTVSGKSAAMPCADCSNSAACERLERCALRV